METSEQRITSEITAGFVFDADLKVRSVWGDAGRRFLRERLSVVGLVIMGGGMLRGSAGRAGRWAGVVAAGVLLLGGWQVGHSGGELAYRHGAAAAYHQDAAVGVGRSLADDDERENER